MKRILITASTFILSLIPAAVFAQVMGESWSGYYEAMVEIPGVTPNADTTFVSYVNALYGVAIVVAAIIAVIKLVLAGAKYMMTDVVTSKGQAIEDIKGALPGLLIILTAFLILRTINPQLTNIDVLPDERLTLVGSDLTDLAILGGFSPACVSAGSCQTFDCPGLFDETCVEMCRSVNGIYNDNFGTDDTCFVETAVLPPRGPLVEGTVNTYSCPESVRSVNPGSPGTNCSFWCTTSGGTPNFWGGACDFGPLGQQTTQFDCPPFSNDPFGIPGGDCGAAQVQCESLPDGVATVFADYVLCTHN